jgi:hypothetical protein
VLFFFAPDKPHRSDVFSSVFNTPTDTFRFMQHFFRASA